MRLEPRTSRRATFLPAMLVPLSVDVGLVRRPWANWGLIAVTIVAFLLTTDGGYLDESERSPLVLDGFGLGLLGHVLLHASVLHLLGNMLFLWVFGNAVCARIGSAAYLLCYALFAVCAALCHLALSDRPAVGASGAINGVVGMFVVLYPKDYVNFSFIGMGRVREVRAFVLVCFWLIKDLLGLLGSDADTAHAAHLGGFASGFVLTLVLLKAGRVPEGAGATLLDLKWRR
jgi:membrane associated rhomboid family serine protease